MAGTKMEEVLKEWFDRVDSDKTGSITSFQLQRALGVGNLQFPIYVVQQMIRMYDFDKNGTMSFEEFVALNKFLLKVQQAFSDLERGRGFLVPDEVYEALLKLDISLDSPAFYTVCEASVLIIYRALIKKRKENFGWMISCPFVYLYNLLGTFSILLTRVNRAGSLLILINLSTALQIVEYEAFIDILAEEEYYIPDKAFDLYKW